MAANARSRTRALRTALALALPIGTGVGLAALWEPSDASRPTGPLVDILAHDAAGDLVFATQAPPGHEGPAYALLGGEAPGPVPFHPGEILDRPGDLRRPLRPWASADLAPGARIETPLLSAPYGDWDGTVTLDRTTGPFPFEQEARRPDFEKQFGPAFEGQRVTLEVWTRVDAYVVSVTEDGVTYRSDLAPDQEIPLVDGALVARILPGPSQETFYVQLEPTVGQTFATAKTCSNPIYTLTAGSYRVRSVDDDVVTLDRADALIPDLLGRDLRFTINVVGRTPDQPPTLLERVAARLPILDPVLM